MAQVTLQINEQKNLFSTQITNIAIGFSLTVIVALALAFALNASQASFIHNNIQDTTDTIAMYTASSLCTGADAEDTAVQALALNPVVQSMQNVNITIANPPPAGVLNAGDANYVYVELTGEKSNYFSQFIHGEPRLVTAIATTNCG